MADEKEVTIKIKAVVDEFTENMEKANASFSQIAGAMEGNLTELASGFANFAQMGAQLGPMVVAIAAAGIALEGIKKGMEFIKDSVKETLELAEAFHKLSYETGASYAQINGWVASMNMIGGSINDMEGWMKGATRSMKANEEQINANKVATRDAAGAMLPFEQYLKNVTERAAELQPGLARNEFLVTAMGRAGMQAGPQLTRFVEAIEEGRKTAEKYGLTMGEDDVKAMEEFQRATGKVQTGLLAMKTRIGSEILPILNSLVEMFEDELPSAIDWMVQSTKGIVLALNDMGTGLKIMAETARGAFFVTQTAATTTYAAIKAAASGNLTGAMDIMTDGAKKCATAWDAVRSNIEMAMLQHDLAEAKIMEPPKKAKGGGEGGNDQFVPKGEPEDQFAKWKEELAQMQADVQAQSEGMDTISVNGEISFWSKKAATAKAGTQEYAQVWAQLTSLIKQRDGEISKADEDAEKQRLEVAKRGLDSQVKLASEDLALTKEQLKLKVALGKMTQEEEFTALKAAIMKEYQVKLAAYEAEAKLYQDDPVKFKEAQEKILQIKKQNAIELAKVDVSMAATARKMWEEVGKAIQSALSTALQDIVLKSKTLGQALQDMMASVGKSILKMLSDELAARALNAAKSMLMGKEQAASDIPAAAGTYAVNAMASVAAIPMYGWAMAPEVGASALAEGLSMLGVASAAGGFDIPAGMNPVTQLHQREMVLPEEHAETIRGLKGGSAGPQIHIHAMDAKSFKQALMGNQGGLLDVLRTAVRNGRS